MSPEKFYQPPNRRMPHGYIGGEQYGNTNQLIGCAEQFIRNRLPMDDKQLGIELSKTIDDLFREQRQRQQERNK